MRPGYGACAQAANDGAGFLVIWNFGLDARGQRSEPVDRHLIARGDVRQPVRQRAGDGFGCHGSLSISTLSPVITGDSQTILKPPIYQQGSSTVAGWFPANPSGYVLPRSH